jgi:acetylornithine deacetylase/succinyl-diaminopimelate desuccinylase family protein
MMNDKILKNIENSFDELKELLRELVKQDTTNPPGNEYLGVKVVQKFLNKYNIPYEIHSKEKGRENIIVRIGKGDKRLFSAGHLDIVPVGDLSQWKYPPFDGHVEGNIMYGRGTMDNKGSLAGLLITVKAVWEIRDQLNGIFIAAGVADEEKGSKYGTEYLMEKGLIDCNWAIIPDIGGNLMNIDVAEKGIVNIKITTHGKSAHGSTPEKGINAIEKMAEVIGILNDLSFEYEPHEFLSAPTKNIGTITGGSAPNMVADRCEIIVNIRYLPSQTPESIVADLKKKIGKMINGFDITIIEYLKPSEVDPDNILVNTIIEKTKAIAGRNAKRMGLGGGTVCKTFIEKGIPAVGWGPGPSDVAHIANEYIDLKEVLDFSRVMAEIVIDLLK